MHRTEIDLRHFMSRSEPPVDASVLSSAGIRRPDLRHRRADVRHTRHDGSSEKAARRASSASMRSCTGDEIRLRHPDISDTRAGCLEPLVDRRRSTGFWPASAPAPTDLLRHVIARGKIFERGWPAPAAARDSRQSPVAAAQPPPHQCGAQRAAASSMRMKIWSSRNHMDISVRSAVKRACEFRYGGCVRGPRSASLPAIGSRGAKALGDQPVSRDAARDQRRRARLQRAGGSASCSPRPARHCPCAPRCAARPDSTRPHGDRIEQRVAARADRLRSWSQTRSARLQAGWPSSGRKPRAVRVDGGGGGGIGISAPIRCAAAGPARAAADPRPM